MTADVVIVVHNSGDVVLRCLGHLEPQAKPHSVVVVDNASSDGSTALIRERHPWVEVVEMGHNAGFSAGTNAGAARGHGDVVVALNDDVFVEPDFLEQLLQPFGDPAVGMVAALTLRPDGLVDSLGIEVDRTLMAYNRLAGQAFHGPVAGAVAAPMGAAAAYRRSAFEAAGGFDETFFSYGEDLDLGLKIAADGWNLVCQPTARGMHLGGSSWNRRQREKLVRAGFGRGLTLRRYGVLRTSAAPRVLLIEALVVIFNLLTRRTIAPLGARLRGWRAAGQERRQVPPGVVERSVSLRQQLRRMRA